MPILQYRPTSSGRRFQTGYDFGEITKTSAGITRLVMPRKVTMV